MRPRWNKAMPRESIPVALPSVFFKRVQILVSDGARRGHKTFSAGKCPQIAHLHGVCRLSCRLEQWYPGACKAMQIIL